MKSKWIFSLPCVKSNGRTKYYDAPIKTHSWIAWICVFFLRIAMNRKFYIFRMYFLKSFFLLDYKLWTLFIFFFAAVRLLSSLLLVLVFCVQNRKYKTGVSYWIPFSSLSDPKQPIHFECLYSQIVACFISNACNLHELKELNIANLGPIQSRKNKLTKIIQVFIETLAPLARYLFRGQNVPKETALVCVYLKQIS